MDKNSSYRIYSYFKGVPGISVSCDTYDSKEEAENIAKARFDTMPNAIWKVSKENPFKYVEAYRGEYIYDASDVMYNHLTDIETNTYKMYDDLFVLYETLNENGKVIMDKTMSILLNADMQSLGNEIIEKHIKKNRKES